MVNRSVYRLIFNIGFHYVDLVLDISMFYVTAKFFVF